MRLKLFILSLIMMPLLSMQAQNNLTITGKVVDKSGQPISYATVTVKEGATVITGSITDDSGDFEVKGLAPKNYNVEIQFIGYKPYNGKADLTTGQKSLSLNRITLADEATQLEGVEVVAERSTIEQKIDRKVINVGRDLTTAGATASEIMNNIPSVNVDQDGKISLRGNQNVRVLIDGRPTNMDPAQLLKQIPSTSIKKIELITNPSAKYNPEGMSGIINIVLHKNSNNGFNGSLNSGITFAKDPKFNNSLDMNYRTGKVNFFGNAGSNFGKYHNEGFIQRFDNNSQQKLKMLNDNESYLYKIGMDYYIDDNNTISFYTNQNSMNGKGNVDTDIPVSYTHLYYTGSNGTGTMMLAGQTIYTTQTVYIYKPVLPGQNCTNEISYLVTINPIPQISSRSDIGPTCQPYTLTPLAVGNYYTEPNGQGRMLNAGDVISATQTIYIYAISTAVPPCSAQNSFTITIVGIEADSPDPVVSCDSYILPALTVGNYYTQPNGLGIMRRAGDVITTSETLHIYAEIDNRGEICSDDNLFPITIVTRCV